MQVLTVHAAKGLEWDVVAVPTLVEGVFPAHGGATSVAPVAGSDPVDYACTGDVKDKGWLIGLDSLPYDLRGDRDGPAPPRLARRPRPQGPERSPSAPSCSTGGVTPSQRSGGWPTWR